MLAKTPLAIVGALAFMTACACAEPENSERVPPAPVPARSEPVEAVKGNKAEFHPTNQPDNSGQIPGRGPTMEAVKGNKAEFRPRSTGKRGLSAQIPGRGPTMEAVKGNKAEFHPTSRSSDKPCKFCDFNRAASKNGQLPAAEAVKGRGNKLPDGGLLDTNPVFSSQAPSMIGTPAAASPAAGRVFR